jgi:DNA-binding phage protein
LTVDQALAQVRRRRRSAERAEQARQKAVGDLYAAVKAAVEAGVPVAQVAREAGLSRQGVYNVLTDKRK